VDTRNNRCSIRGGGGRERERERERERRVDVVVTGQSKQKLVAFFLYAS